MTNTHPSLLSRNETKFLFTPHKLQSLLTELNLHASKDPHTNDEGFYLVRSLYLDTYDLKCFHDHMAARAHRFKLRWRWHGDESTPRLELKLKENETIHKHLQYENQNLPEIQDVLNRYPLRPNLVTTYRRYAFSLDGHRVTLDTNLTYNLYQSETLVRPSEKMILEVKGDGQFPQSIRKILNSHQLVKTSFSKYVEGIKEMKLV